MFASGFAGAAAVHEGTAFAFPFFYVRLQLHCPLISVQSFLVRCVVCFALFKPGFAVCHKLRFVVAPGTAWVQTLVNAPNFYGVGVAA